MTCWEATSRRDTPAHLANCQTLLLRLPMTAAEAQGYADRYQAARWDPVEEELRKLEASTY